MGDEHNQETRSILFTNLFLGAYSGSELHVLQMARAFRACGWRVACYALIVSYPLMSRFRDYGIDLIEFGSEDQLDGYYDVLYAQHHVVSDYLIANQYAKFHTVVVSVLGPLTPHEFPSQFVEAADLVVFSSGECRDAYCNDLELDLGKVQVFPNYANEDDYLRQSKLYGELSRIAVVSNHVPEELRCLQSLFLKDGIDLVFYGWEGRAVEVTSEVLAQYDLVITIGRTVPVCMAASIPVSVYCYDVFGGPGYIMPEDLDRHAYANFSGRSSPTVRSAEALYRDIIDGYSACIKRLPQLKRYAESHFRFESLFDSLRGQIERQIESEAFGFAPEKNLKRSAVIAGLLATSTKDNLRSVYGQANVLYHAGDSGEGRTVSSLYRYGTEIHLDVALEERETAVSFSPSTAPCYCKVLTPGSAPMNANEKTDGFKYGYDEIDVFYHGNPQYSFKQPPSEIEFLVIPIDWRYASITLDVRCAASVERENQLHIDLDAAAKSAEDLRESLILAKDRLELLSKELSGAKKKNRKLKLKVDELSSNSKSIKWTAKRAAWLVGKRAAKLVRQVSSRKH